MDAIPVVPEPVVPEPVVPEPVVPEPVVPEPVVPEPVDAPFAPSAAHRHPHRAAEWYGYVMRRLAERPANLAFFLHTLTSKA